jgi:ring-1,2-phenylacetyl-CoA epoxidase subunit PaaE
MDVISEALRAWGVDQSGIHREVFTLDPGDESEEIPASEVPLIESTVEVNAIDQSGTFRLSSRGESILSAALKAGLDLPYSCRQGMCATCRARLLDGSVVMTRSSGLEQTEIRRGFILACQAHPTTERVSVDFDA